MEKTLTGSNFRWSLDVQLCFESYIALDISLCAKTAAFKYEYQVLHLKQMFSGE